MLALGGGRLGPLPTKTTRRSAGSDLSAIGAPSPRARPALLRAASSAGEAWRSGDGPDGLAPARRAPMLRGPSSPEPVGVAVVLLRSVLALVGLGFFPGRAAGDDWPQWRGPERDGVWRESGLVEKFSGPILEPKWRAKIGSGYSGPTVADGRVYLTDRWTEEGSFERVHCFDQETGEPLWTHRYECSYRGVSYDAGPRASVLLHEGRAFSLGAMGHLNCLDAASGEVLWSKDLGAEYAIDMPIWGIAASPLIEDDLLIVPACGDDACLIAFEAETGDEVWTALSDPGNYSAPVVLDQAGERVLVYWSGERVVGLDPHSGELFWEVPFGPTRMPLGVASPVVEGDHLFVTGFYDGCLLLRLDQEETAVEELWRRRGQNEVRTDGLQSIISTPYLDGEHIYGVDSYGQLRCLRLADGERVWEDLTAVPKARWSTIHFVRNAERTWMFNERGDLIIARLTPTGYEEISRAHLLEPTLEQLGQRGGVCWSHPAFADRHVFARNDEVLVCADLAAGEEP